MRIFLWIAAGVLALLLGGTLFAQTDRNVRGSRFGGDLRLISLVLAILLALVLSSLFARRS